MESKKEDNVVDIARKIKEGERKILALMVDELYCANGHMKTNDFQAIFKALPEGTCIVGFRNDMVTHSTTIYFYHELFPTTKITEPVPYFKPTFENLALDQSRKSLVLKDLGLPSDVEKKW